MLSYLGTVPEKLVLSDSLAQDKVSQDVQQNGQSEGQNPLLSFCEIQLHLNLSQQHL